MHKIDIVLLIPFFFILFLCGCETIPIFTNPSDSTKVGTLKISLTDAPGDFDEVNIRFLEISAHLDGEWITVRGVDTTVNLLELSNGQSVVLGSADVPAGKYTQIRIKIDTAWVVVDGVDHELTVPSGAKTGLKLGPQFTIQEGSTYELMVDFDANRSIVTTGPPHNPQSYKLKPRLRVISTALTGSISGTVKNSEHLPIAYAIAGSDTVTSTAIDTSSGTFRLAFLPAGLFMVSIRDTLNQAFEKSGVGVVPGTDNYLGELTLQE